MRGHLTLARIRVSLPLKVLIDMATLYEFARDNAHKANNDFRVLEGGFKARIRLFYKSLKRKRLDVSAIGKEVYYATKKGAI